MAEFKEVIQKRNEICKYYSICIDCPLYGFDCNHLDTVEPDKLVEIVMNWEKPTDWSNVEIDTKVLVRDAEDDRWKRRYFAKYENGKVYTYSGGHTSWNSTGMTSWIFAKLYKED